MAIRVERSGRIDLGESLLFWSRLLMVPTRGDASETIPQPVTLALSMATSLTALNVIYRKNRHVKAICFE
jgi:hypothetical protein